LTLSDNVYVNINDLPVVLNISVHTNLVWKCIHLLVLFIVNNNIFQNMTIFQNVRFYFPTLLWDRIMSGKLF
jgi:hypothetical protein